MIGFIKKDLVVVKSNFKLLGILMVVYTFMALLGKMDLSFIMPFVSVMLMISTFSYDTYNKWDAYSVTLPDGRKNSVKSKYITTIILILTVSIITIILSFIISYINTKTINYEQILSSSVGTIFGTLLVLTIMYPIIYKFGIEKGRIAIFLIVFGIIIIGGFLIKYINLSFLTSTLSFLKNYLILIIILITIIMVYASYKISIRIFNKKEF